MRRFLVIAFVSLSMFLAGCQSHQAKVDALQKEYDQLGAQYRQDCSAEMLNIPPKLSPKCSAESKKLGQAYDRLKAERAKQ